jgi:branched-chain amino acid transport system ATP-binding protein
MNPKLLLIDELSLGLAPKIVGDLIEIIQRLNEEGVAVVIVDQHVDLALDVAARAYFIERGEIRFSGPSDDLRGRDDLLRSVFLRGEASAAAS